MIINEDDACGGIGSLDETRGVLADQEEQMVAVFAGLRRIEDRLDEIDEQIGKRLPRTKYMTKQEVAQFLHESVRQVDRRRARGEICQGVRIGRRRLFLREEIESLDLDELAARGGTK